MLLARLGDVITPERFSDVVWLNATLGSTWPGGELTASRPVRIGEAFGLSGEIYRLHVTTTSGAEWTLIAKIEDLERHRRAERAHRHAAPVLGHGAPALYGTAEDGVGALLIEDIHPAEQGDDIAGCSREQSLDIVGLVGSLHHRTRFRDASGAERWQPRTRLSGEWATRLARAAGRYPDIIDAERLQRLERLLDELPTAGEVLTRLPETWIHVDPHLDNVLWRPDGSPVLIDWSNARRGPPAIDLAALLIGHSFRLDSQLEPETLLAEYAEITGDAPAELLPPTKAALKVAFISGIVAWAGEESNEGFHPRKIDLRDSGISRALLALEWVDR